MTRDPIWWLAVVVQLLSLPGTLLPVLPGLLWLPLGAGLWCWHVGWSVGWPAVLLAVLLFGVGMLADLLAVSLATATLDASRWSAFGAAVGIVIGLLTGGLGLLIGPWAGASVVEHWCLSRQFPEMSHRDRMVKAAQVGLAVVVGLLVSQVAQLMLAVGGVVGFVLLSGP